MKNLIPVLVCLAFIGCKATDAMDSAIHMEASTKALNSGMNTTNDRIGKTNDAIHKQTLKFAWDDMLKFYTDPGISMEERLEVSPAPMTAGGKSFAIEATADELAEFTASKLREIEALPADFLKINVCADNNLPKGYLFRKSKDGKYIYPICWNPEQTNPIPGAVDLEFPDEVVQKQNYQKHAKLMALQAIAGFIPQAVVQEVIDTQIKTETANTDAAQKLLAFRFQFINSVLLQTRAFKGRLNNMGMIEYAVEQNILVDFIAKLPEADSLRYDADGFLGTYAADKNLAIILDKDTRDGIGANWRKINRALDPKSIKFGSQIVGATPQEKAQLIEQEKVTAASLKALVGEYLKSWPEN